MWWVVAPKNLLLGFLSLEDKIFWPTTSFDFIWKIKTISSQFPTPWSLFCLQKIFLWFMVEFQKVKTTKKNHFSQPDSTDFGKGGTYPVQSELLKTKLLILIGRDRDPLFRNPSSLRIEKKQRKLVPFLLEKKKKKIRKKKRKN